MRNAILAIAALAFLCGCAKQVQTTLPTLPKLGDPGPIASPSLGLGFTVQNNSNATVYHSVATSCMSSIPSQYWANAPVAPGQSLSYSSVGVFSGSCSVNVLTPKILPQSSIVISQPSSGRLLRIDAQMAPTNWGYAIYPVASPCEQVNNDQAYTSLTIGITIPPSGFDACFAPQPPTAVAPSAGAGEVSFAVLNSSSSPIYFWEATQCMSGTPTQWWSPYAIAPGQQISYIVGTVGSGSCFGDSSYINLYVQSDTSSNPTKISIQAGSNGTSALSYGGFAWSTSMSGPGTDPNDNHNYVPSCVQVFDVPGQSTAFAITIPSGGVPACWKE